MYLRLAPLLVLLIAPAARADSPIAEVVCAPRAEMVNRLTRSYGANMAASGIRDIEAVMEVWTAPSGQWTLVQTYADGRSCILAMGADWDMPRLPDAG
jgi:hypothetical protein